MTELSTTLSFKQEFTSSPEWNHFWGKARCPGLSCFLKALISHLMSLLFFPDSSEAAFCDCSLRTAHLVMTMGWCEKGHSHTKWVVAPLYLPAETDAQCLRSVSLEGDKSKVVEKSSFSSRSLTWLWSVTHHSETSRPLPVHIEWRTSLSLYLIN